MLLTLDKEPVFARQPGILAFAYRVQGFAKVWQDVELVE